MRSLVALLLTACIADHRPISDDGGAEDGADGGASVDAASTPDASTPDAATPDAATPDAAPCTPVVTTYPTDGFYHFEPVVAGAQVFGHCLDPQGISQGPGCRPAEPGETSVRAVDLADGAPVGGPTDLLVDAEGTARLLLRPDGAGHHRLIYREHGRDLPLFDGITGTFGWGYEVGARRVVAPGRAAWLANDAIYALRDGQAGPVWLGPAQTVATGDGHLAWVGVDGGVHVAPDGQEERRVGQVGATPGQVVPTRDHVWWLADGRPMVWRPGDPEGRPVTELSRCEALDAEGPIALVTCRTDPDVAPGVMIAARIHADGQVSALDRAAVIMAPRAAHGALAWARYDDPDAWCATQTEGTLRWWPAGEPAPLDVATVGSGCLCCGAFWPTLQIDLGPRLVAWNYAGTPREAPAIGVARCGPTP